MRFFFVKNYSSTLNIPFVALFRFLIFTSQKDEVMLNEIRDFETEY
jgi:hypothetical protein